MAGGSEGRDSETGVGLTEEQLAEEKIYQPEPVPTTP